MAMALAQTVQDVAIPEGLKGVAWFIGTTVVHKILASKIEWWDNFFSSGKRHTIMSNRDIRDGFARCIKADETLIQNGKTTLSCVRALARHQEETSRQLGIRKRVRQGRDRAVRRGLKQISLNPKRRAK